MDKKKSKSRIFTIGIILLIFSGIVNGGNVLKTEDNLLTYNNENVCITDGSSGNLSLGGNDLLNLNKLWFGSNDWFSYDDSDSVYTFFGDTSSIDSNRAGIRASDYYARSDQSVGVEINLQPLDQFYSYGQIVFYDYNMSPTQTRNTSALLQSHDHDSADDSVHQHIQFKTYRPSNGDMASRLNIGYNVENAQFRVVNSHAMFVDPDATYDGSDIQAGDKYFFVEHYGTQRTSVFSSENSTNTEAAVEINHDGTGEQLLLSRATTEVFSIDSDSTSSILTFGSGNDMLTLDDSLGGMLLTSDGSDALEINDAGSNIFFNAISRNILLRRNDVTLVNLGSSSMSMTVPIAFNDNEIQRAKIQNSAAPVVSCGSSRKGLMYYDTDTNKPCYCNAVNYVLFSDDTTICS